MCLFRVYFASVCSIRRLKIHCMAAVCILDHLFKGLQFVLVAAVICVELASHVYRQRAAVYASSALQETQCMLPSLFTSVKSSQTLDTVCLLFTLF